MLTTFKLNNQNAFLHKSMPKLLIEVNMLNQTDTNKFRLLSKVLLMSFVLSSAGFVTACDNQGPAEEAGEAVDESVEETGDAFDDATE